MKDKLKDITVEEMKDKLAYCEQLVGKKVYFKTACAYINTIRDKETGYSECPFESSCEFAECNNDEERIFETTIDGIFNEGNGWRFLFKYFRFAASLKDFGETVFFTKEEAEK